MNCVPGLIRIVLVLVILAVAAGPASSSAATKIPKISLPKPEAPKADSLAPDQVAGYVAQLSDTQARHLLLTTLETEAKDRAERTAEAEGPQLSWKTVAERLQEGVLVLREHVPTLPEEIGEAMPESAADQDGRVPLALLAVAAALIVASLAEWRLRAAVHRRFNGLPADGETARSRAMRITGMIVLDVTGVLLFCLVSLGLGLALLHSVRPIPLAAVAVAKLVIYGRILFVIAAILFRPRAPHLRLLRLHDRAARLLERLTLALFGFILLARTWAELLVAHGLSQEGLLALTAVLGTFVFAALLMVILLSRRTVETWLEEKTTGPAWRRIAGFWHLLAGCYLLFIYALWLGLLLTTGPSGSQGIFLMGLLAVPVFLVLDRLLEHFLRELLGLFRTTPGATVQVAPIDEEELPGTDAPAAPRASAPTAPDAANGLVVRAARLVLRLGIALLLLLIILHQRGLTTDWTRAYLTEFGRILLVMILFALVWGASRRAMDAKLAAMEVGDQANPRLRTLLPLLHKVLAGFLLVTASLIIASQLGVQVAPLLASAGVFGLALGLGLQTLVKDVVAGIFFLMDDAFRVGDSVQLGKTEGRVVRMSIRTITVIHPQGYMQTIPFGDISNVVNYSRGPIVMKLKIPMPMDTDPKVFKQIIQAVNEDIMGDEALRESLVQPVKSKGVAKIQDSMLHFGIKFTAKPGTQFAVKRMVYTRILKKLKQKGLSFGVPRVAVLGSGQEGEAAAGLAARGKKSAGGDDAD